MRAFCFLTTHRPIPRLRDPVLRFQDLAGKIAVFLLACVSFLGSLVIVPTPIARASDLLRRDPSFFRSRLLVKVRCRPEVAPESNRRILLTGVPGIDRIHESLGISEGNYLIDSMDRAPRHRQALERVGLERILHVELPLYVSTAEALNLYSRCPDVERVELDVVRAVFGTPSLDPLLAEQWHLHNEDDHDIDAPEAWAMTRGSPGTLLAVLDTGIDQGHPELHGRVIGGYDFVNDDPDASDDVGHGTAVAGIVAARALNGRQITGVDFETKLLSVKVLGAGGAGKVSDAILGVIFAAEAGADVLNMSYGGAFSASEEDALLYAQSLGVVSVAAVGNEGSDRMIYPAALLGVIGVGATDRKDRRATSFPGGGASSFGGAVEVVAPGEWILTLGPSGTTTWFSGTSAATPIVSGIATLLRGVDPTLPSQEVRSILRESAEDQVGRPSEDVLGFDSFYGYGRVNAARSVAMLLPSPAPVLSLASPAGPSGGAQLEIEVHGGPPGSSFALACDSESGSYSVRGVTLGLAGPSSAGFHLLHRLRDQPLDLFGCARVSVRIPDEAFETQSLFVQGGLMLAGGEFVVSNLLTIGLPAAE